MLLKFSSRRLGLVEQRLLADDLGFAALAPLGTDVVRIDATPPIRTEIRLGLDEGAGVCHHVEDALIERFGAEIGLARNSVMPASRAKVTRVFSV